MLKMMSHFCAVSLFHSCLLYVMTEKSEVNIIGLLKIRRYNLVVIKLLKVDEITDELILNIPCSFVLALKKRRYCLVSKGIHLNVNRRSFTLIHIVSFPKLNSFEVFWRICYFKLMCCKITEPFSVLGVHKINPFRFYLSI